MRLFEEGAPASAAMSGALTMLGGLMAGSLGLLTARRAARATFKNGVLEIEIPTIPVPEVKRRTVEIQG